MKSTSWALIMNVRAELSLLNFQKRGHSRSWEELEIAKIWKWPSHPVSRLRPKLKSFDVKQFHRFLFGQHCSGFTKLELRSSFYTNLSIFMVVFWFSSFGVLDFDNSASLSFNWLSYPAFLIRGAILLMDIIFIMLICLASLKVAQLWQEKKKEKIG